MQVLNLDYTLTVETVGAIAKYTFVGFDGNTAAPGTAPVGVAIDAAPANDVVTVARACGACAVVAGGALTAGQAVEVGPNGTAVAHQTGVIAGYVAPRYAAGQAGDVVLVLF